MVVVIISYENYLQGWLKVWRRRFISFTIHDLIFIFGNYVQYKSLLGYFDLQWLNKLFEHPAFFTYRRNE